MEITHSTVQEYYGKVLSSSKDLKTSACCSPDSMPAYLRPILSELHSEVVEKFYGCGSPIPLALEGKTVLDLGSGTGRDSFIISRLVGEKGSVVGIDMTDEQLTVANRHIGFHQEKFGYKKPNIKFYKGFIEDLKSLGIADNSVDVVVSNCVINLSPDKKSVFKEIFRILKPGGELYFSDIFSSRRIPKELKEDSVLLGECLGGAIYVEDFRRILLDLQIRDYRIVSKALISLFNQEVKNKVGPIDFYSITIRAFKMDLEDRCEDYGQLAIYQGTISESPLTFMLDDHHIFEKGRPVLICSNTARMLANSRFSEHFQIIGEEKTHFGIFDCTTSKENETVGACC
jgi:arsenite methyltransferase